MNVSIHPDAWSSGSMGLRAARRIDDKSNCVNVPFQSAELLIQCELTPIPAGLTTDFIVPPLIVRCSLWPKEERRALTHAVKISWL